MHHYTLFKKHYIFLFFLIFSSFQSKIVAQNLQQEVLDKLLDFHSIQKEIVYLHLNKSILLQGEQLGFAAYVLDPNSYKPFLKTTNLYIQVKDSKNTVVKEKMLLMENGTGAGAFDIDSTFTSGDYTITAFTNWMRNFNQQYFFQETIKVIKTNLENKPKTISSSNVDIQFLPESGHLLQDTYNKLGIVIKDSLGYGLANASIRILTTDNKLVGNTRLNKFGIGQISLVPKSSETYKALINYNSENFAEKISVPVDTRGIIMNTNVGEESLEVALLTNAETITEIGQDPYIFSIQNASGVITYEVKFQDETSIVFPVSLEELKPGMNILTLFDKESKPIAERLFFNSENLPVLELSKSTPKEIRDSLQIKIPTKNIADSTFLSVSILPKNSITHKRNHNIISYFLLQPYVKGSIEDASWYFENIDAKKKQALNLLLLTQGWSSYDWNKIFNKSDSLLYTFESYVDLKAQINGTNKKDQQFLIHASSTNEPTFIDIAEDKDSFIFEGIKPIEGESLFISRLNKNGGLQPAGLSVQFFPHHIKDFNPKGNSMKAKSHSYSIKPDSYFYNNNFGNNVEQLDEVLIETSYDRLQERERKLSQKSWGSVDVLDEVEITMFNTLGNYLRARGFNVTETPTQFMDITLGDLASESRDNNEAEEDPTLAGGADETGKGHATTNIMIDGVPIYDPGILYQYSLSSVDYIEIDRYKMQSSFVKSPVIKIFSDFDMTDETPNYKTRIQKFDFPLSYALNKQFYVPKYQSKTDEFFQQYGVIDWKSDLFSEGNRDIQFEIEKPQVDYQMIIEGFTAAGDLIYEVQTFEVN